MKILLLGGTGAMGTPLIRYLADAGHEVYVTSRRERKESLANIHFVKGNAKEDQFLFQILSDRYDVIVDFMHYHLSEFETRKEKLLNATGHYFFLSSSRVYAPSDAPLTEESPRLLDVVTDKTYLRTDEYALSKARCEDTLKNSGFRNWTIIRPYITYNTERLQLSIFEKEAWLYRALRGNSIVFAKDLAEKKTTLTHGDDVAKAIQILIEQGEAFCEAVHIVGHDSMTWSDVLKIYISVIEKFTGNPVNVVMLDSSEVLSKVVGNTYKWKYDRMSDRVFDSSRADMLCGRRLAYKPMTEGLTCTLENFISVPHEMKEKNLFLTAYLDRCSGEKLPGLNSVEKAVKYFLYRYTPYLGYKLSKRESVWW